MPLLLLLAVAGPAMAQTTPVRWISSTESQCWREMPAPRLSPAVADAPAFLKIDPGVRYQPIFGFGGCFNELAWQALEAAPAGQREEALKALFAPDECDFTMCRVGIGANDFALRWYSLDETPGDYPMNHFNIDEDRKTLIPYIKAAMRYQPKLVLRGAPWSPPAWMKVNGSYHGGNTGRLKQDPQTLAAYALYFSKYVQAYRAEGIPIQGIFPQNEPRETAGNYPQCGWSAQELDGFIRDYLVPRLKKDQVNVEVWLGTLSSYYVKNGMDDYVNPIFGDPVANPMLTGLGGQYGTQELFQQTHDKYPDKKIIETETECYHGENSWPEAMKTFNHLADDSAHFANGYMYWNMILGEKATSSWGWHQNSLIIVDSRTRKVVYNPDFYALKHFSHLVRPGAFRVGLAANLPHAVAFRNPDGDCVVCFSNATDAPVPTEIELGGAFVRLDAPAQSMNSVILSLPKGAFGN